MQLSLCSASPVQGLSMPTASSNRPATRATCVSAQILPREGWFASVHAEHAPHNHAQSPQSLRPCPEKARKPGCEG